MLIVRSPPHFSLISDISKGAILMPKKKKIPPLEQLQALVAQCNERYDRWNYLHKNGGVDPFWSDGVNLNLIRNHIYYYKREIKALCEQYDLVIPSVVFRPIPLEMPNDFYVTTNVWYTKRLELKNRTSNSSPCEQLSLF